AHRRTSTTPPPVRTPTLAWSSLAPLDHDRLELLGSPWQLARPAGKLVGLKQVSDNIYISAGAEASRFVFRHRAMHRLEQILHGLAAPIRHERVERQRRDFHDGITGEVGTVTLLAGAAVRPFATRCLRVSVDAVPHGLLRRRVLRESDADDDQR